jgi:transposase
MLDRVQLEGRNMLDVLNVVPAVVAGRNAAVIWTVTATARMAGLNVPAYLTAYFDECGRNGGKPLAGRALERFLPWNASPEDLRTWAQPPPAGPNPRE